MAIPAALFIRKYSYKKAILLGLALYAIGAFLFIPAAAYQQFSYFCISLYILTFGLAFLETTANPLILSLGSKETATRRLNLAQAFNPIGSLCGMAVASQFVLPQLISDKRNEAGELVFFSLSETTKDYIRLHDLAIIRNPYVIIGLVVVCVFILIAITKIDNSAQTLSEKEGTRSHRGSLARLWKNRSYREGVFTQMFYVAAQIMVWTFIIHYADALGIDKATAQKYNIIAMIFFLFGRFISTMLMKYINGRKLLVTFACGAIICTLGTIFIIGHAGLYCLVGISLFMSLMFPTIYGIALKGLGDDAKFGAAGLIMAILGGSVLPPFQAAIIDQGTVFGSFPATNASFILPFFCFAIIAIYGWRTFVRLKV